ncbi:MAG: class I SAM-dependent methyltransferase [Actinobacteria bacterium]|nr:class I SAM-dependent methyltransferase [Actinomycetota bacterium]
MENINEMLMEKEEYSLMYKNEEKLWWYKGLQDLLFYYIKKFCKRGRLLLDAGCGTGKNMDILISEGFKVKGIDISDDSINFCKSRGINDLKSCSICNIEYESDFFDLVYCIDVLGNLSDQQRKDALKEFYRVLKPSGILILNSAALKWLSSQHDIVVGIKKRFAKKELIDLIESTGFENLKCTYRVFLLFPIIVLVKVAKTIFIKLTKNPSSDQWLPPKIINDFLTFIQMSENKILKKSNLPIGSSIFLIVMKP